MNHLLTDQTTEHRRRWLKIRINQEALRFGRLSARAVRTGKMSPIDYLLPTIRQGLRLVGLYQRGAANARDVQIVKHELTFADLPPAFDGYRLLHLTDFHIDSLPGLEDVISEHLTSLPCDSCVFTGDYRFLAFGDYSRRVQQPLQRIMRSVRASDGTYAVLGNHDTHPAVHLLESMGVRMLLNESVTLNRGAQQITLTGTDDPHYYHHPEAIAALRRSPEGFKVALIHSPELYAEAAAEGYQLYLCGHTHGGQVCLPGGTPVLRNLKKGRHLARGLWQEQQMIGYTSAGCGVSGLPVRFFSRGEITLFTLRRGR
ncbi:MAG: metallophosphoesterase [Tunicatimonas sp.]